MIYQHPLAYLLGVQGAALLRAFGGDYDRDFTEARLAEVREMLRSPDRFGHGAETGPIATNVGYRAWAGSYDQPGNGLIDLEQPVVRDILDGLPRGTALDAACGTGRHAEYLASLGHEVIGVDASPEMLAIARARVPGGDFRAGDLCDLPVPDRCADVVACALALEHVPDLAPVMAEFARVLRPGGHLVISDSRNDRPVVQALPGGDFGYLPHRYHHASDYLAAALPQGFGVRSCQEPLLPQPVVDPDAEPPSAPPGHPSDIWSLWPWFPAAVNAFYRDKPVLIVWHFQLGGSSPG